MTNMLIQNNELGRLLASCLGESAMVLMRGHGDPTFLPPEEAVKAEELHHNILDRPWNFWKSKL